MGGGAAFALPHGVIVIALLGPPSQIGRDGGARSWEGLYEAEWFGELPPRNNLWCGKECKESMDEKEEMHVPTAR